MFAAATAKENAYAQFFHEQNESSVYCEDKELLRAKMLQFALCGRGYSIRHDRAAPGEL